MTKHTHTHNLPLCAIYHCFFFAEYKMCFWSSRMQILHSLYDCEPDVVLHFEHMFDFMQHMFSSVAYGLIIKIGVRFDSIRTYSEYWTCPHCISMIFARCFFSSQESSRIRLITAKKVNRYFFPWRRQKIYFRHKKKQIEVFPPKKTIFIRFGNEQMASYLFHGICVLSCEKKNLSLD